MYWNCHPANGIDLDRVGEDLVRSVLFTQRGPTEISQAHGTEHEHNVHESVDTLEGERQRKVEQRKAPK